MTTSQTPFLSKPSGEHQISHAELAYIRARGRQQAFNLIHSELKRSGISQATLTRRLGKSPEVVSRLLKRPGNWEQDTVSELLFAISGGSFGYRVEHPASSLGLPKQKCTETASGEARISAPSACVTVTNKAST